MYQLKTGKIMDLIVIDDEPVSRMTIANTLRSVGYRVTTFDNADEAIGALQTNHTQLVVCDRNMPGMSGVDFCRAVRKTILERYIYIVILTSHDLLEDVLDGLEAGADDYLPKSCSPAELIMRVNTGRRIIRTESSGVTIFSLAKLAESRDQETGAHLERVRRYCCLLAEALRDKPRFRGTVDDEFIRLLYETSPLHDIGKVAVADAILLKPGPLTAEEFELMKSHTSHGADTLAAAMVEFPNAEFLQMAHDIALYHHERFNGQGYPRGLAGDSIPLCARITALADVYDALTSKRVYKDAMSHAEARALIVGEAGEHFDPDIVDAFIHVEDKFISINNGFRERDEIVASAETLTSLDTTKSGGFHACSPA